MRESVSEFIMAVGKEDAACPLPCPARQNFFNFPYPIQGRDLPNSVFMESGGDFYAGFLRSCREKITIIFLLIILLFTVSCARRNQKVKIEEPGKTSPSSTAGKPGEPFHSPGEVSHENLVIKEIEIAGNIPKDGIHKAAIRGDLKKLEEFAVKDPRSINQRHLMNYGRTPLHYAAIYGKKETVEYLISKGAEVDVKDVDHGRTPLHYAVIMGNAEIAELLISKGANIGEEDEYGWTPLHHAVINGQDVVTQYLIDKGAKVSAIDEVGKNPLHYATTYGHSGIALKLISAKANVNRQDEEGRTPLHYAVKWKAGKEMIEMLIGKGADLNIKDEKGLTPLETARIVGNSDIEKLLLSKGAKDEPGADVLKSPEAGKSAETPDVKPLERKGLSPLQQAIMNGDGRDKISPLLDGIKNINEKDDIGKTLLHESVMYGNFEAVKLLISKGAEINAPDDSGRTPLHYCAVYGLKDINNMPVQGGVYLDIAKFLISKGADVNVKDRDNRIPLHHARSKVMTELFLDNGGNVKAKDKNGWTPLHWAAMQGFLEVSKALVNKGADVNARDNDDKTPLDAATIEWRRDEGHSDVAAFLRKHGGVQEERKDEDKEDGD